MASQAFSLLILFLISVIALSDIAAGSIGVDYGRVGSGLPSPNQVVELLKSNGITQVKIYDTDANVLRAFANSGISLVVALPNELLRSTATDQSFADNWVRSNISPFYPATKIEAIAVGNEVFQQKPDDTNNLVQAMKNVQASLVKFNMGSNIKISSPISFGSVQVSWPPSSGSFNPNFVNVIGPMLEFLEQTGSYLMVNIYPYFTYSDNGGKVTLDYALGNNNPGVVDPNTKLTYFSLFDAQIDAVYSAISSLGQNQANTMRSLKQSRRSRVPVIVTESGWPSGGGSPPRKTMRTLNEIGASVANAQSYYGNLVQKVLSGKGTPLRPQDQLNVYLFALFDENQKQGSDSERNFGLFNTNGQKKYNIQLTNGQSTTWCVAKPNADQKKLQEALNYACGQGKADCGPIQPGAPCYNPNTLEAHASYAFNSYYQKNKRGAGTCDFGGVAYVVSQPPRYGNCDFPTGN